MKKKKKIDVISLIGDLHRYTSNIPQKSLKS
ncbi:unnamed protein product, partial [marine sediment metagenome]